MALVKKVYFCILIIIGIFLLNAYDNVAFPILDDSDYIDSIINHTSNKIITLPTNKVFLINKKIIINRECEIVGNGGSTFKFLTDNESCIEIKSNLVKLKNINIKGNNNTNIIKLLESTHGISLEGLTLENGKVGIETTNNHKNIYVNRCVFNTSVHGVILRDTKKSTISNCVSNDHKNGGTGIHIKGLKYKFNEVKGKQIFIGDHNINEGDTVRIYGIDDKKEQLDKDFRVVSVDKSSISLSANVKIPIDGYVIKPTKEIVIISNKTNNNRAGIYLLMADKCKVLKNIVSDETGIQLEQSWHNLVSNNKVKNARDLGINLHYYSSYNIISDNNVTKCGNAAIGLTADIKKNNIARNNYNIIKNNYCAFSKKLEKYPTLTGNGIEMNMVGIGNIIENNTCEYNENFGIRVPGTIRNTLLKNNKVSKNNIGIKVDNDDTNLENNYINNNNEGLVLGDFTSGIKMKNNVINNNRSSSVKYGKQKIDQIKKNNNIDKL